MSTTDPTAVRLADLCAALEWLGILAGDDLRTVVIAHGAICVTRWPDGESTSRTSVIHIDMSGSTP